MDYEKSKELFQNMAAAVRDSAETYPETKKILDALQVPAIVLADREAIRSFADELFDADNTETMLPEVAAFVEAVLLDAIADGNAAAACNLGSLYYTGRIGIQSYSNAVTYYTIAAEGGDRQAAENLGYCYYYGRDVEKDYEKAFHYFALGAFDGHLNSLYKIGDMYRNGYYVKKNEAEAYLIYSHCLSSLSEEAMPLVGADIYMRMGDCLADGIGTERNAASAFRFYQVAEMLFYDRLKDGDFLIANNYKRCISRQSELRAELQQQLPPYEWTKKN